MEVWAPEIAARAASKRSVPTFQNYADTWLENRKTRGPRAASDDAAAVPDAARQVHLSDVRRDAASTDLGEDVNDWYDALAPGRETIRAQAYSLLRTIFTTGGLGAPAAVDPVQPGTHPGSWQRQARPQGPAGLADELQTIVEELPTATS